MTRDQRNLLRAILARPDDDSVRLLFADACEEAGEGERGEFVRLQCRIAHLEMVPGQMPMGVGREALLARERELFSANELKWTSREVVRACDWLGYPGGHYSSAPWKFRRGFIESIQCRCGDWLAHGPAVVAAQPVTTVTTDRKPQHYHNNGQSPLYGWYGGVEHGRDYDLPRCLWEEVAKYANQINGNWADFWKEEDALAAASTGFLAWARAEAERRGMMP